MQLKISLDGFKPLIWRRFLVEDSISFHELHNIIQNVMGWENYHMYEFQIGDITITNEEAGFNPAEGAFRELFKSPEFRKMLEEQDSSKEGTILDTHKINKIMNKMERNRPKEQFDIDTQMGQLIIKEDQKIGYVYDFGDNWKHSIVVENISEKDPSKHYPVCIDGEMSCPPEDCGSVYGYEELLKIRENKNHPEYQERIVEWLGEDFNPNLFVVDWVNARLHGKKPEPIWVRKEEEGENNFVPLGNLLKEDTDKIKKIKALFNKEEDYEDYLGEIEFTIANYFLENRKLKDKDVENIIKDIKKNYTEKIDFFKNELEKKIMLKLSIALQEESTTHHELKLVLDYVLWCIDNRSWMQDKQAFVKYLPYFFGLYDKKESEKYKQKLTKVARRMGIPQTQIDALLGLEGSEVSEEQKEIAGLENELFSLDDGKKFEFIVENGLKSPSLIQSYIMELDEKEDFEAIESLCKKMMELSNNFPMFEFLLGLNYNNMGNPILAKHHMENAFKNLENAPSDIFEPGEKEQMLNDMRRGLRGMR
ncbi:plasmid pRiA4b ORF-3 family protein [Candidatus Woesearchaeota archaeon]|nr:plasmid pRiA4b ORF-3 family protein [Candidatus Woesearchaeota archaeon]